MLNSETSLTVCYMQNGTFCGYYKANDVTKTCRGNDTPNMQIAQCYLRTYVGRFRSRLHARP